MSLFKVEQMMFLKLNQGCLPEVQKYNAVIAAQQERRSQCLQDVQSAQEAAAGETVDVEIYKSLYVAVNACLKLKAWEMSQFGTKDVECKPDRNRPADLTWNCKPYRNQTADLTRDRKPDRSKPSFSGTIHAPTAIM